MRVLVTGGAGFIGSHIVDLLIERGHSVAIVDNFSTGREDNVNPDADLWTMNIQDDDLGLAFHDFKPTHVCHQAAQASLLRSEQTPNLDAKINILGTLNIISLVRLFNARMVMASTSAVYMDAPSMFLEQSPCLPNRPYGISKYAAERYLEWSGLSYAILRYGNVYGPRQVPVGENQIVPRALDGLIGGKPFSVYGDGTHSRDYVFVEDVARANVAALESTATGIFNISTGVTTSVNTVLATLEELTGVHKDFEHTEAKRGEPASVCLYPKKAADILGWKAQVSLAEGLAKTLAWYKETQCCPA